MLLDGTEVTQGEEVSAPVETTSPVETPTEMEQLKSQLKALQDEKVRVEAEAKRHEEGYKGLQTKYNRTYEENKKLADLHSEVNDLKKYIKILAAQQVELSKQDPDNLTPEMQKQALSRFDEMEKAAEQRRKDAEAKLKQEEQYKRFDEVWAEAQKFGNQETNDAVADIYDNLIEGKLYKAERILKKLQLSSKGDASMPDNKQKAETDEEIFERIAKAKGLLKTDTAVPSGRSGSFEDAEARFASGDISFADYQEARKKAGVY